MYDTQGYEAYWTTLLQAFVRPSGLKLKSAADRNGLAYGDGEIVWGDVEETLCKLAGADHIRKLPWLNEHLSDFYTLASAADARARRTVHDDIYDAISPDESLDGARRKAREMLKRTPGAPQKRSR